MEFHKDGLTTNEALKRLQKFGPNVLLTRSGNSWGTILLSQFKSPLIYILLVVSFISLLYNDVLDFFLIISVLILNVAMGFGQEYGATKSFETLKSLVSPQALVIRNGKRIKVERSTIVPGDTVVLGPGDKIPADGILREGTELLVREAILTGEAESVTKLPEEEARLFMGTDVLAGEAVMNVISTGRNTELGKIGSGLTQTAEVKTPLQLSLENLSKKIGVVIILLAFAIFVIGLLTGKDPFEMFQLSIILAIAGVPVGLPIAITVILSVAAKKIYKKKGLVKQLLSVETLGSTTMLCLDKTGTITEGVMKIKDSDLYHPSNVIAATIVANEQRSDMEISIWSNLETRYPAQFIALQSNVSKVSKIAFSSEKKYSVTVGKTGNRLRTFIIGAPDILLKFCTLSPEQRKTLKEQLHLHTEKGLRTLAYISKQGAHLNEKRKGYEWDGLFAIEDPLRKEVHETLEKAREAGLEVKIITGDHHQTARKVIDAIGLNLAPHEILTGSEIEELSRKELAKKVEQVHLFARVTPHQKLLLVEILQEQGHVVAMTGDGVNDAQALKRADIGVVMGNSSDIAKDAGDLILLNNDFRVIIKAIEQGRLIFANLKKSVAYALSNGFVEMIIIAGSLFLGLPTPLTVAQILWIRLICDGPPDVMLGFEPKEADLMKRKINRNLVKKRSLLDSVSIELIAGVSIIVGVAALLIFSYVYKTSGDLQFAQTITFLSIAAVDLIYVFAFKSLRNPALTFSSLFNNRFILFAMLYGFTLLLGALYVEPLRNALGLAQVSPLFLVIGVWLGLIAILWVEIIKFISRKTRPADV